METPTTNRTDEAIALAQLAQILEIPPRNAYLLIMAIRLWLEGVWSPEISELLLALAEK
jgi:hypothetical protein